MELVYFQRIVAALILLSVVPEILSGDVRSILRDRIDRDNNDEDGVSFQSDVTEFSPNFTLEVKKPGGIRFKTKYIDGLDSNIYEKHRWCIEEALKAWSQIITEDVEYTVVIGLSPLGQRTIAQAVTSVGTVDMQDVIFLLQSKLRKLGYMKMTFPKGKDVYRVMAPPPGATPTTSFAVPLAIMKNLVPITEYRRAFSDDGFDMRIQINSNMKPEDFNTEISIHPKKGIPLYSAALHEMGHSLGFTSGVDQDYSKDPEYRPNPLDLYRFRGDLSSINFETTERYAGRDPGVKHVWYDPYPIDGRVSHPLFSQGVTVDSSQASHWKDDVDGKGTLQTYMGVMDPSLLDSLKYSFTLPDLRAFSRLGYRVSLLAKPVLYELWKKPLRSGTYFGVSAQLLLANTVDYLLISESGIKHMVTSKPATYMDSTEASSDIGKFLDNRRNFFNVLAMKASDYLPDLKSSKKWFLVARNRYGSSVGAWSNPISFDGNWNSVEVAGDFDWERWGETSTWLFPPAPLFRPFDDVSDTIKDAQIIPGVAINRAPSQPAAPVAPKPAAPKPTPKLAPKPGVKTHPKVAPKIPTKPKLPQNRPKVSARQVVSRWVKSAYKRVRGGGKGSSARNTRMF